MDMVRENQRTQSLNADVEAQKHNAQIKERYQKLLSAEADQLASETYVQSPVQEVRASVLAPEAPVYTAPASTVTAETPVLEQVPQVTQFVREQVSSSVFTTEKFTNLQENNVAGKGVAEAIAPTYVAPAYVAPVMESVAAVEVEQYVLSSFAKKMMAGVATAIVALVSIIGINTHVINNKRAELTRLRNRQQELVNENARVQEEIEIATSEDTIRAWAEKQVNGN